MLYIGHTTLETFLREVTPEQPLYLNLLGELLPHKAGIDVLRCYLLLQTTLPKTEQEASILYWQMRIGEVLAPGGIPWERQHAAMRKAGLSAQAAVRQVLDAQPHTGKITEGVVLAMPRELKLVAGSTRCLVFDKTSGTFELADVFLAEGEPDLDQKQLAVVQKTAGASAQ